MPQFSIIIPCYKQAHFLDEALTSVSNQSFSDWEAIVVDDGSPDNVCSVVHNWISRDSRIKLISQQNAGLSAARNIGINSASGNFITLLDADDKYGPDFLKSVFVYLQQGFKLVATGYTYFNTKESIKRVVALSENLNFCEILSGNLFPPVSIAFSKSIFSNATWFDTSLKSAEDWDLWIRMYRLGISLAIIPDSLVFYRISENSMSRQAFSMYKSMKEVALRACSVDSRLGNNQLIDLHAVKSLPSNLKKILLMCMGVAVMQGKISEAIELILIEKEENSLEFTPIDFKYMCTYLSFRYNVSSSDLKWIHDELMPLFNLFFTHLPLTGLDKKKAYDYVFEIHRKLINQKKWGFISPFINHFS